MLLLLLSWVISFFTFISFGEFFIGIYEKICKKEICSEYNFMDKFWIGIMVITVLSILINYFAPLNLIVLYIYLIIALFLNIWLKIPFKIFKGVSTFWSKNKCLSVCFIITVFTILFYSLYPSYIYDSGLYHTQTMQWYQQYPIVPGLGNVHGRLAFNSTTLIISELFNYQLGIFNTFTSIPSVCILVFTAWIFNEISKLNFLSSFYLSLIILLFILSFVEWIASYNTDLCPALLVITLILSFVFSENRWSKPIVFLCLPLLCVTFKLSTVPICLFSLIYFIHYIRNKNTSILIYCVLFGSCFILSWLGRFVIQTGYLIYPFPAIDIFAFDWKMPIIDVIKEKASVVGYTRMPGFDAISVAALPLKDWIQPWYFKVSPFNSMLIILASLSPILFFINYKRSTFNNAILICWLIATIGFVLSFYTAPATRFYYGFVIMSATLPFLLLSDSKQFMYKGYLTTTYLVNFLLACIILFWVFKLIITSIFTDFQVQAYLFNVVDWGYIETRSIEEWFSDKYLNKIIGFGILFAVTVCIAIVYRFTKIKFMFSSFVKTLSSKKNYILLSLFSFALLISLLNFRVNYLKFHQKNRLSLLIKPTEKVLDRSIMEMYQLSPNQPGYYPRDSDRCFDCDLPCSSIYNKNLEMRGAKLSDGFRTKK